MIRMVSGHAGQQALCGTQEGRGHGEAAAGGHPAVSGRATRRARALMPCGAGLGAVGVGGE
jgi:hypothetical protein